MLKKHLLAVVVALAVAAVPASAQEMVVGTFAEVPPFEYTTSDGRTIGFDVDVIKAIGRETGFTPRFVSQPFDTLLDSLAQGRFHAVASALTITDERRAKVDFSDPYFSVNIIAVFSAQNRKPIADISEIRNLRVSVLTGTTCAAVVDKTLGEDAENVRKLGRYQDVFDDVLAGRSDVAIVDEPVARAVAANTPGVLLGDKALHVEEYGFAVRKGDTVTLGLLNAGLKKLRDSGEFELINRIWFAD